MYSTRIQIGHNNQLYHGSLNAQPQHALQPMPTAKPGVPVQLDKNGQPFTVTHTFVSPNGPTQINFLSPSGTSQVTINHQQAPVQYQVPQYGHQNPQLPGQYHQPSANPYPYLLPNIDNRYPQVFAPPGPLPQYENYHHPHNQQVPTQFQQPITAPSGFQPQAFGHAQPPFISQPPSPVRQQQQPAHSPAHRSLPQQSSAKPVSQPAGNPVPQQPLKSSGDKKLWGNFSGKFTKWGGKFMNIFSGSPKQASSNRPGKEAFGAVRGNLWHEGLGMGHIDSQTKERRRDLNQTFGRLTSSREHIDKLKGELKDIYKGIDFEAVGNRKVRTGSGKTESERAIAKQYLKNAPDRKLSDGSDAKAFAHDIMNYRDVHHSGIQTLMNSRSSLPSYSLSELVSAKKVVIGGQNPMLSQAEHAKVRDLENEIDRHLTNRIMDMDLQRNPPSPAFARDYAQHLDMELRKNTDPLQVTPLQDRKTLLERYSRR